MKQGLKAADSRDGSAAFCLHPSRDSDFSVDAITAAFRQRG
jgi:hypothetical protein